MWFFYYFYFERNYDVSKSKNPCLLLKININFNKNETESKMENPPHTLRAHKRKKRVFLQRLNWYVGNFFNIWVLSQCIMYWINFRIYTILHIAKYYYIDSCCLFLNWVKTFSVSLSFLFTPILSLLMTIYKPVFWKHSKGSRKWNQ